jgi:hypothetical protein
VFDEALRVGAIQERTSSQAEAIALRVINLFEAGEHDAMRIAHIEAGN